MLTEVGSLVGYIVQVNRGNCGGALVTWVQNYELGPNPSGSCRLY